MRFPSDGHWLCWIAFCQIDASKGHLGRRNLNWENDSIRWACGQVCGAFSWWMIGVGGHSLLWGVPPLSRWSCSVWKRSWESSREQSISSSPPSPPWPLLQFLPPVSCLDFLPWLHKQPFSFPSCFGHGLYHSSRNLTGTAPREEDDKNTMPVRDFNAYLLFHRALTQTNNILLFWHKLIIYYYSLWQALKFKLLKSEAPYVLVPIERK